MLITSEVSKTLSEKCAERLESRDWTKPPSGLSRIFDLVTGNSWPSAPTARLSIQILLQFVPNEAATNPSVILGSFSPGASSLGHIVNGFGRIYLKGKFQNSIESKREENLFSFL